MVSIIKLLLPALLPSWRFFDAIGPSPRIQYALLPSPDADPETWLNFRPKPQRVTLAQALIRLFWNPVWNESLYLLTCAERCIEDPEDDAWELEILSRVARDICPPSPAPQGSFLTFRLELVDMEGAQMRRETAFRSRALPCVDLLDGEIEN